MEDDIQVEGKPADLFRRESESYAWHGRSAVQQIQFRGERARSDPPVRANCGSKKKEQCQRRVEEKSARIGHGSLSHFERRIWKCDVAHRAELGLASQFSFKLAATRLAQCKARFQPQRLDREAIFCALRLHVDPPDEARALEKGKDVVAIFPFVPRNKNLDVVIEAEDALEALSIA